MLADLALQQGHVELGGAIRDGGYVVFAVSSCEQLSFWAEQGVLHGNPAVSLSEGCLNVGDVFVSLDQAISLLTSVAGQTKVKPPNFKTIWTISLLGGQDLDLCPLTDFVYHAALKAPGKRFKKVWEGILTGLVLQLYAKGNGEGRTTNYTQINFSECSYNRIGEKKEKCL